ncbi:hypothetical protein ACQP1W_29910 [Spirillospora sp. CA-255316]
MPGAAGGMDGIAGGLAGPTGAQAGPAVAFVAPAAVPVRRVPEAARVESVRIADDADLDAFARTLLELFDNPKNRQDLRSGRLRFHLAATSAVPGSPGGGVRRVERGAVTERDVKAAAEAGERIVLGPRAVLTPLGREKARTLGVHVTKER